MGEHHIGRMPSLGQFTTMEPEYDKSTRFFRQSITFEAKTVIPSEMAGRIVERACHIFRDVLAMNELHDHAWPPEKVLFDGYKGGKAILISLGTHADKRKPVILLQ